MILVVLDGWGLAPKSAGNAIALSDTPTMTGLAKRYSYTRLRAHGKYAGLPRKQVGNSEAGHMNIGAGRVVEQDSVRISKSIKNGTFFKNSAFTGAIRHTRQMKSKMHIIGMLSNGQSPHSDPKHLLALLNMMKKNAVPNVYIHLFTDGRDSPKYASLNLVSELEKHFYNNEKIATVVGRFYAMDRKKKWSRTERAYNALVLGQGIKSPNAGEAITHAYNRGESDEFIQPTIIHHKGENCRIEEGDSVIFFNLRSDRGRQLTKTFVQPEFQKMNPGSFKRRKKLNHIYFVAMTDFGPDLNDIITAYPGIDLNDTLPMVMSDHTQMYLAETEKYAHVTYFFNGGYSGVVDGEVQKMVPSPDVKSYDETPSMSSDKLTRAAVSNINTKKNSWKYDFLVMNYAAPDMIGHTGNLEAGIKCCRRVDKYLSKVIRAYLSVNGTVVITADHGNIEKMINPQTKEIHTEHTTNPVPFIIVNKKLRDRIIFRRNGVLGDIAPTILNLLGLKKPAKMKGRSLIQRIRK